MKRVGRFMNVASIGCLLGAVISAVVMVVRAIGNRYGMLIGTVPATDAFVNDIIHALRYGIPVGVIGWGVRIWCLIVSKEIEEREKERV